MKRMLWLGSLQHEEGTVLKGHSIRKGKDRCFKGTGNTEVDKTLISPQTLTDLRDMLRAQVQQSSVWTQLSAVFCWSAKVRMIPPCVPQVIRLDSSTFTYGTDVTTQWPWTYSVQRADSESVSSVACDPFTFASWVWVTVVSRHTWLGSVLLTNH